MNWTAAWRVLAIVACAVVAQGQAAETVPDVPVIPPGAPPAVPAPPAAVAPPAGPAEMPPPAVLPPPAAADPLLPNKPPQGPIAARPLAREPLDVHVLDLRSGVLVGNAEVAIYGPTGDVVRRGKTEASGSPFLAEQQQPLEREYRQLRIVVRKFRNGRCFVGAATVWFDHNNWRPEVVYERPADNPKGKHVRRDEFDRQRKAFVPLVDEQRWTPPPVIVAVDLDPIPVTRLCYGIPCCSTAPPDPCCERIASTQLPDALPPADIPITWQMRWLAHRDRPIVALGVPPRPEFPWAEFGNYWVCGPQGAYWEAPAVTTIKPR